MDQPVPDTPPGAALPPELAELLLLGQVLGQNLSFAIMAGRCSAAQAEALLRIRESRLYLRCSPSWKQFCPEYLHISGTQADRIIRLWQLHGPAIFELRQPIRISPEAYNAVEPFIQDHALHFNAEAIELDPQNSQKIADAVAELRRAMPPKEKPAPTVPELLAELAKQSQARFSQEMYQLQPKASVPSPHSAPTPAPVGAAGCADIRKRNTAPARSPARSRNAPRPRPEDPS